MSGDLEKHSSFPDVAGFVELSQGLVHGLHSETSTGLYDRVNLVYLVLPDEVTNRRIRDENFTGQNPAGRVLSGDQLLAEHSLQDHGQLGANLALSIPAEAGDDAVERRTG